MAGFCDHGYERSGSIKANNFLLGSTISEGRSYTRKLGYPVLARIENSYLLNLKLVIYRENIWWLSAGNAFLLCIITPSAAKSQWQW
jgi:hypothetical protein